MTKIYPDYFKKFKCLASLCPDTCCAGWEIVIDEKYRNLYKSSSAPSAKEAAEAMYTDDDGDVCLKLKNGRCPMLNDDNLCRLYIDMGKDSLCDVCRIYPRFNKEYDDYVFTGLSLSCPEAARLILCDDTFGSLNTEAVFKTTSLKNIFEIYKKGISKSLPSPDLMLEAANIMLNFEILTDEWRELCLSLKAHLEGAVGDSSLMKKRDASFAEASQMKEIKNIEKYYLYKYLAEALDSGDTAELLQTAAVCTAVITELYAMEIVQNGTLTLDKALRIAQLFSKEIEHSGENLNWIVYQTPQFL